ncbi:MAG: hypothetical protein AAFW84_13445, partial [Cyanobacteria bacterium J06635_15]
MRVLLWIDTFFQYAEEGPDGYVTTILNLISKDIVEGSILKRTFEELSTHDRKTGELLAWLKGNVNILDIPDQDIR